MKATGIVRRFDDLGRINIPKEIRRGIFKTESAEGKPMEIFVDGDSIVLKKYEDAEMRKAQEICNKAIDEFAERLKEEYKPCKETDAEIYAIVCKRIDEIAEQMKGGVSDE